MTIAVPGLSSPLIWSSAPLSVASSDGGALTVTAAALPDIRDGSRKSPATI